MRLFLVRSLLVVFSWQMLSCANRKDPTVAQMQISSLEQSILAIHREIKFQKSEFKTLEVQLAQMQTAKRKETPSPPPVEKHRKLCDLYLTNQESVSGLLSKLPDGIRKNLNVFLGTTLARNSSLLLFEKALQQEDGLRLAKLLGGLEARIGIISAAQIIDDTPSPSEEEGDYYESETCPPLGELRCRPGPNRQSLWCRAAGQDSVNSGEAWIVGIKDWKPVVIDWKRHEQRDRLVPMEELDKWFEDKQAGNRSD